MKKLMLAAAAIAAGVAVADVTSANVVGYANDGLSAGKWKPVCSQFIKIGTDGAEMKLKDLVPNLDGGTTSWQKGDAIKVMNTAGGVDFQAKYRGKWSDLSSTEQKLFNEATFVGGWYKCDKTMFANLTAECANDTLVPFGSAVLAKSTKTAASIGSNGEVYQSEDGYITIGFSAGKWLFVGNSTPINLTLKDFEPNLDGGTTSWQKGDTIKIFNTAGGVDFQAKYRGKWSDLSSTEQKLFNEATFVGGWYKCDKTMFANLTAECVNSTEVNAGCGFLAKSTKTAATIKFPTAL